MTFFVDANVIVYAAVPGDYREPCVEILTAVARGEAEGRSSAAVLEEVWYLEVSGRVGRLNGLARQASTVFSPLLPVTDEAFRLALSLQAPQLGPNDRLHAGTCLAEGVEVVVSADAGFRGIRGLRRVDPLDANAVRRLLNAQD